MTSHYIYLNKHYLLITIFVLIMVIYAIFLKFSDSLCLECIFQKKNERQISENFEDEIPVQTQNSEVEEEGEPIVLEKNQGMMIAPLNPKLKASINRQYNPLQYPYKSDYFYDQKWYPNLKLPFQVIGGGRRMTPTLGGTQVPILNPPVPIRIDDENIAPNNIMSVNMSTRGPEGVGQQIGVIYKIYGTANDMLPLYGRKRFPNDNQYDYWTTVGPYAVKVPVVTKNRNYELGDNDVVFIKGSREPYRITMYNIDQPMYIPYI